MSRPLDYSAKRFTAAEKAVLSYMSQTGVLSQLSGGVVLALSGGADSVFLLHLFARLANKRRFPLLAVHVNHHLRGIESDRDEAFCRELCASLGVPFECRDVDVAAEMKKGRFGTEEAARRVRYRALRVVLAEHPELSCIATAHHATDQLETVLFQMLRGGGLRSVAGMAPMRLPLIRPLLCLSAKEIKAALSDAGCSYVTDSTNTDVGYARNYLRHEILPRLLRINPMPERAILRMTESLSHDGALLDALAHKARRAAPIRGDGIDAAYLRSLHEALRRRVLIMLYEEQREKDASHIALEYTHIVSISRLLQSEKIAFSLAVPNRLYAVLCDGAFSFCREPKRKIVPMGCTMLSEGDTTLPGGFFLNIRHEDGNAVIRCYSILHKIDITATISSDIINGDMFVRTRMPKDAYRFRGHTHSLKKLYNEAKIPLNIRPYLPILCDGDGILWVPFFPIREKLCED